MPEVGSYLYKDSDLVMTLSISHRCLLRECDGPGSPNSHGTIIKPLC